MDHNNEKGLSTTDPGLMKLISKGSISFKAFDEDILALESIVAGTSYLNLQEIEKEIIPNETKLSLQ